jgi:hypothetical protein
MGSKESTFRFKNGEKVTLAFSSKKFVGKPKSFQDINISDISALENIRIEFEIDLKASKPEKEAENLLKLVTGNKIIRKFSKQVNFPETITDSSLVEMEDIHGNIYE